MALYVNGEGQESFNIDGIDIERLYVDTILVWEKDTPGHLDTPPMYEMTEEIVSD